MSNSTYTSDRPVRIEDVPSAETYLALFKDQFEQFCNEIHPEGLYRALESWAFYEYKRCGAIAHIFFQDAPDSEEYGRRAEELIELIQAEYADWKKKCDPRFAFAAVNEREMLYFCERLRAIRTRPASDW